MLNPFPIQFLALFAYFLLRFFAGSVLIFLGLLHHYKRPELRDMLPYGHITLFALVLVELGIGTLLILGAFTQYAALAGMLLSAVLIIFRGRINHPAIPQKIFYVMLFAALLSLFITGAGAIAFDLPI